MHLVLCGRFNQCLQQNRPDSSLSEWDVHAGPKVRWPCRGVRFHVKMVLIMGVLALNFFSGEAAWHAACPGGRGLLQYWLVNCSCKLSAWNWVYAITVTDFTTCNLFPDALTCNYQQCHFKHPNRLLPSLLAVHSLWFEASVVSLSLPVPMLLPAFFLEITGFFLRLQGLPAVGGQRSCCVSLHSFCSLPCCSLAGVVGCCSSFLWPSFGPCFLQLVCSAAAW